MCNKVERLLVRARKHILYMVALILNKQQLMGVQAIDRLAADTSHVSTTGIPTSCESFPMPPSDGRACGLDPNMITHAVVQPLLRTLASVERSVARISARATSRTMGDMSSRRAISPTRDGSRSNASGMLTRDGSK